MQKETKLNKTNIYNGQILDLYKLEVKTVDGFIQNREVLEHNGGACIVALTPENEVYLVRQYRIAVDDFTLEVPAGKLEKDEDPESCAIRELEEECGLKTETVELISAIYPTPGYSNEIIYIYYADSYSKTNQHLDQGEFVQVEKYLLADAIKMIQEGKIKDAKTIIALQTAWIKLNLNP